MAVHPLALESRCTSLPRPIFVRITLLTFHPIRSGKNFLTVASFVAQIHFFSFMCVGARNYLAETRITDTAIEITARSKFFGAGLV